MTIKSSSLQLTDSTPFPYFGELGTTNLNSLTAEKYGVYRHQKNGDVYSGLNYPVDSPGSLLVLPTLDDGCSQEYRSYDDNSLYRRRYYKSSFMWLWSSWCQEYNTENPPSAGSSLLQGTGLPVGAIIIWYSRFPPSGWLCCDGSSFSVDEYPSLAEIFSEGMLPLLDPGEPTLTYIIKAA